jgi:hypothetical protein
MLPRSLCLIIIYIISNHISAQEISRGLDSVDIAKPKKGRFLYEFQDRVFSSVQIREKSIKRSPVSSGEVFGNIGRGALALLAGPSFTFGSSKEVFWNLRAELESNNENLSWEINLLCPGILEKNKQRVTNDDGSYSVDTEKTAYLNWHEEATGFILEHGDTIAKFIIIMDPRTNPLLSQWNEAPYRDQLPRYQPPQKHIWGMPLISNWNVDFGIVGILRGNNFVLLYNGELWQSWLFDQDRMRMIFNADIDDLPMVTKKDRLIPTLKINQPYTIQEKYDLMRMAIMSRYLSKTVNRDSQKL